MTKTDVDQIISLGQGLKTVTITRMVTKGGKYAVGIKFIGSSEENLVTHHAERAYLIIQSVRKEEEAK